MYRYSVPSKIFVLGEYGVLAGLPCVVATCSPRFVLQTSSSRTELPQVPAKSPWGRLLSWTRESGLSGTQGKDVSGQFFDPIEGRGGLGASSAQFAMAFAEWMRQSGRSGTYWQDALKLYQDLMESGPFGPSGADLVAQICGGVIQFDPEQWSTKDVWSCMDWSSVWVFSATDRPGRKVATHSHLDDLKEKGESALMLWKEQLEQPLFAGLGAIESHHLAGLGAALNQYAETLSSLGLECAQAKDDRESFNQIAGVYGAKGAGAMLADCFVVVTNRDPQTHHQVDEMAKRRGLSLISRGLSNEMGLTCQLIQ